MIDILINTTKEIINFVGEPIKEIKKNIVLICGVTSYYILGFLIYKFPDSKMLLLLWEERKMQLFLANVLIALASYGVAFFILPYCKKLKMPLHMVIKSICLVIMMPFHLLIKLVSYILMVGRQKNVAIYLGEYMIAAIVALGMISILCNVMIEVQNISGIVFGDNLVAFLLVAMCVSVFFFIGEKVIYLSFSIENRRLEQEDFKEKWSEIRKEIQYTNIYFYIIANIFLLCAPVDEGGFERLFVNTFFGVTTLAALMREVRSNIERDETGNEIVK